MRTFANLLLAGLILAIMNYLTVSLGIILVILVLMSAITYPRRTMQLFAALGLLGLVLQAPAASAAAIGAVGVAAVMTHHMQRHRKGPLIPTALLASPASA